MISNVFNKYPTLTRFKNVNKFNISLNLYNEICVRILSWDVFRLKKFVYLKGVREYSTKKSKGKSKLFSPDKLISRADLSLNKESLVYQQLSNYLRNSPINEDTQLRVEKFLLDYSYISYNENKEQNDTLIDYSLISNDFTKLLKSNESTLNNYINLVRNKVYNKVPVRQKEFVQYQLSMILKELPNNMVLSIMFGRLLRIVTNFNRLNTENNFTNICTDLGRDLIGNYYYSLYSNYIVSHVDSLIKNTESLLDNNIVDDDSISFSLNKISKSMNKSDKADLIYYSKSLSNKIIDYVLTNNLYIELDEYNFFNYTLSNWKDDNKEIVSKFDDIMENLLGARILDLLIDVGLVKVELKVWGLKDKENTIVPTDLVINTLKDRETVFHLPQRVPMIVKPKPYFRETIKGKSIDRLGGYLLNDENVVYNLIIDNWELKEKSIINDKNIIFDLVNNMSSVGFKINKELLDFINRYGVKYDLIIDKDYQDPLLSKNKLFKVDRVKLEGFLSRKLLQENILGLANVYSNVPEFYLPVRLDYRGRMNCISEYLNYQSTELAKALLLFSKPEKISKSDTRSINYFKAYGANCFGNRLDKKSWNDRIKWVDDNVKGIINFQNGDLISKAENKLIFIAFCIEYNRWIQVKFNNDITYFETHLPIQLDATCNGYQHLSLLSLDYKLAKELNLAKSTWDDAPKDFYGFISAKLTDLVQYKIRNNEEKEKKESFIRLSKISLVRKIVKKAIMTIPYNVTVPKMIDYIQESFELCEELNKDITVYEELWYQLPGDPKVIIKQKDFTVIAMGIKEILNNDIFKLNKLLKYLKDIAKICTTLAIPIPWSLPSGIIVKQSYLATKDVRLKPFTFSKNSFLLKIPDKSKYNVQRQIRAFMPNLVHSLDATSLAMLVDLYFNSINGIKNLYSIHDCFAVTANNVDNLMQYLKLVYINIYSDNNYLKQLDKQIIEAIKSHCGKECFNDSTLVIDTKDLPKMKYPNIKAVLDEDLDAKFILDSSYIIH
jgi:DNA-dependent RNA polymerase